VGFRENNIPCKKKLSSGEEQKASISNKEAGKRSAEKHERCITRLQGAFPAMMDRKNYSRRTRPEIL